MKHLLFFLTILAAPCLDAQVGLGLTPMRQELRLQPGQSRSGSLELTNEHGGLLRIRAELLDFFLDATMTPQFARSIEQENAWSCRDWLTLNPMESELETGGKLLARFTMRVPESTPARSYHCAAGFTALPPLGGARATGIRNAVRVVAVFYVTVGGGRPQGEISALQYEEEDGNPRAVLSLRNDSDYYFRPEGVLEALDAGGAVIEAVPVPGFPVLPRREQRLFLPLSQEYARPKSLRVRVDLGLGEVQEATVHLADTHANGQ
jgi:hypothetical protein